MPTFRFIQSAFFYCFAASLVSAFGQTIDTSPSVYIKPRPRPEAASMPHSTFRLDVKLIQIPVTITDARDKPVMDLDKSNFRVFEDDIEQRISSFSMSDAPVSGVLVFDSSGSMKSRIVDSRAAVEQFFRTANPNDEFSLIRFSDKAELLSPFTRNTPEILKQLSFVQPHGWTAMLDGICRSIEELRRANNPRRVIVVLSDGGDNNSRYSEGEVTSLLREADARVFAIGLFERPRYLEKIADETGGHMIWVHKLSELPEAMEKLSVEIRNEYVIGYFSDRAQGDGRYHKVRVEVQTPEAAKPVRISWRRGYVEP